MLSIAAIVFAAAAVGGVVLAYLHFRQQTRPWLLTLGHGALAATGLALLIIAFLQAEASGMLTAALVLFLIAALGGFFLIATRLRGKALPSPAVVVHGLAAVVAFITLLLFIL